VSPLETAIERIRFSRQYTLRLIEGLAPGDWFRMPAPAITHIAWQVGHLAMAQYRLTLDRIRGERPADADLISPQFLKQFGKDSVPVADAAQYPEPAAILETCEKVHRQSLAELAQLPESEWGAAPLKPHPLFHTKLDSLFWCAHHEMLHAGQIGLLHRMFGYAPKW
jgi:DinB superfamily